MSLFKRKDSPYWWIKHTHNGRTVQKSSGTTDKAKAQEYHDKLKAALWDQERLGIKPSYSWKDAVVRYLAETTHKKSQMTDMYHLRWLSPFLEDKFLQDINRSELDGIAFARKKTGVSDATVNRTMRVLTSVLRKAVVDWEWLDRAPKYRRLPEPQKRIRWLSKDEANRLFDELPSHLEAMARFSLATGLRQANVYGLTWTQVDLVRQQAWIYADQAKAGKSIPVPLSSEAITVLRGERFKHPNHVFTYKGKPVTHVNGHAWRNALKRAGITNFRWHDLRHTWASWHVQNGTPLYVLQQLGGWHSLDMVQKYAHLSSEHLVPYLESISGLFDDQATAVATKQLRRG